MPEPTKLNFNRYELKYLIPYQKVQEIIPDLGPFMLPDEYGDNHGRYVITSLYYDTPDFRFYHEKVNGLKQRRKLRIRVYETGKPADHKTTAFVEIKERVDKIIRKRRVQTTLGEALALCNDGEPIEGDGGNKPALDEMYCMAHTYNLKPTVITSYLRQAFQGTKIDRGLRITFDTNCRYRRERPDLTEKDPGHFMIPPNMCIMEIKTNNSIPIWLTQLIAEHNLQIFRISKYCTSLERAEERIDNTIYSLA